LQIYIPFIAHVHNSFLEVWIEQGIAGAFGLLLAGIVILGWAYKALGRGQVNILGWAGLAAVSAVFLHGLVDVVFYVSRTLPVIGLVIGLAWWVNALPDSTRQPSERRFLIRQTQGLLSASLVFLLVIAALVLFYKPARAAWQANLGALRQSHFELSEYEPANFARRSIDDLRKEASEPLIQAETSYQVSLEIDPANRTALQRLASMAFSRNEYAESLSYAQALWQAGHRDPTSRLLLGEALTADGQIAQAAEVLSGVTWAEYRLMGTAWYRYWLGGDAQRAANAWAVVLLLNPGNQDAARWVKEAQSKLK
jgi:hypothetical protein